jgi:hypothetical protein
MLRAMGPIAIRIAALGLIACSARAIAGEGLPDARRGIRTMPILLLTRADVRTDLQLSPEQAADADRLIADLHEKALALKGRNDTDAVSARAEIDAASRVWIEGRLTPLQRDRLIQLDLRWEGLSAIITRPIVAESLGLTDAQRTALAKAVADRNSRRNGGPAIEADEAKLNRFARAQLTEAQERRLQAILGAPFDFRSTPVAKSGDAGRP